MAQYLFTRIGHAWAGFVCLKLLAGSFERSGEFVVL